MEWKINSVSTKDNQIAISIGDSIELKTSNFSDQINEDLKTWYFGASDFEQIFNLLHRAYYAHNFQGYPFEKPGSFEITEFTENEKSTSCKFVDEESTIDISIKNGGRYSLETGKGNIDSILKEAIETMKNSQEDCMRTSARTSRPPYGF